MFNWSIMKKILLVIPITVLCNPVEIVTVLLGQNISMTNNSFFEVFIGMNYTNLSVTREKSSIVCSMFGLAQPIIFNFLFGTYIYNDLHISSIYLFIRESCKIKWFIRKIINLFVFAGIYCFLQVVIPFSVAIINSKSSISKEYIVQFAAVFFSFLFLTFLTTLFINILSIAFGSAFGFIGVYCFMIACFYQSIKGKEWYLFNGRLLANKLNPIDNSIVLWHNGIFDIVSSILINLVYIFILIIIGAIFVNKVDISLSNKENNV